MGAINNAFNQAAGAVAGAALAIKHAKETDFSKAVTAEHSALVAKNQAEEAEAAAKDAQLGEQQAHEDQIGAKYKVWSKEEEYKKAQKDYANKRRNGKNPSLDTVYKKFTELEAANSALEELNNKINGIQTMKQRALDQRAYADKASQIASEAQQRYQSKWGGK